MSDEVAAAPRNFAQLLHDLRSRELTRIPQGARTVLSGGVPNTYYFEWFEGHYPSPVERHIAVEPFVEAPADLPAHVEWIPGTLGDLGPVATGSVDLVFAGQVIEHLWADDVVSFLAEAHRVLAPDGLIVLDSVNRRVTAEQGWVHPEHTIEFTVDEIVEILALAGFEVASVRGVWLCYDREAHRILPVDMPDERGAGDEWRGGAGEDRPEDSMIWWAEARRAATEPDRRRLKALVQRIGDRFRRDAMARLTAPVGRRVSRGPGEEMVAAAAGEDGYLIDGPNRPLPPGRWRARFRVGCPADRGRAGGLTGWEPLGSVSVATGDESAVLASRDMIIADTGVSGAMFPLDLEFTLQETTMGVRFRVHSNGSFALRARLAVDVAPLDDASPEAPARIPSRLPPRPVRERLVHPNLGLRRLVRRTFGRPGA